MIVYSSYIGKYMGGGEVKSVKRKGVPVYAMNLGARWMWVVNVRLTGLCRETNPAPVEYEPESSARRYTVHSVSSRHT
jgi:hypothetical protein